MTKSIDPQDPTAIPRRGIAASVTRMWRRLTNRFTGYSDQRVKRDVTPVTWEA